MQVYLKNINLLIVKIPCIIMGILMLCAIALITNSQYTELTSNFDSQCKQYDNSINLLLSRYHSMASFITKNTELTDNLTIENFSKINNAIMTVYSSTYDDLNIVYIVNDKNEYLGRTTSNDYNNYTAITYDDVTAYNQITLLYNEPQKNSDGFFSLVYPLYNSTDKLVGGLVILLADSKITQNIPYDKDSPYLISVQSTNNMHNYFESNHPLFLHTQENKINVPGEVVTITLRASIFPVIKTAFSVLVLFLLLFSIFYLLLKFFAYCVNQSINQPLEKMQDTIRSYTSSVAQTKKPGSDMDE